MLVQWVIKPGVEQKGAPRQGSSPSAASSPVSTACSLQMALSLNGEWSAPEWITRAEVSHVEHWNIQ